MAVIELSLPYPPSANRLWRAVNGRNIKSAEYRDWLVNAYAAVLKHGRLRRTKVEGAYRMTLTAERPDRRRRDLSNLLKPTEDLLQYAGIVADDCNAEHITLAWSAKAPSKAAVVRVRVEPIAEPA